MITSSTLRHPRWSEAAPYLVPGGDTFTCLGCAVDWRHAMPCWFCGGTGTRLDRLPDAARAEHFMSGQATVSPSGGDGSTCPL